MHRTISQSMSKFTTLTSKNCGTCVSLTSKPKLLLKNFLQFDVSLHHQFKSSCVRLCTSAKHRHVETQDSEEHKNVEKTKTNRKVSGGKKKRRLRGERSILTDPGVPVPQEMQRDELIEWLAKSAIVQGKQHFICKIMHLFVYLRLCIGLHVDLRIWNACHYYASTKIVVVTGLTTELLPGNNGFISQSYNLSF